MSIPATTEWPCWLAGLPDEDYHAHPAVSSSLLKAVSLRTPAHAQVERKSPRPETPALLLGRALHCRVLKPDTYHRRFAVAPKVDRRTTAGKETWAAFVADNPEATILTEEDGRTVAAIAEAIDRHPVARHAVRGGQAEVSGFWTDEQTGLACRCRPDYLRIEDAFMVDLKSTACASRSAFERSVQQLGYQVQAAFYAEGYHAITGHALDDFLFITAEKAAPYAVAVYRLDDEALEIGRKAMRRALTTWAECAEAGRFPAYPEHIETINLPAWALTAAAIENEDMTP